ncbi:MULTISPECIES: hypothetical protein [unclassified Paenibacillus]|uniref:hypothetical protein n=1 Tax=unclassified Paenibacillus TaxID=185978 RepID=UPI0024049417|nr:MULTISPECIES: hypothetical protein [unclassified Paenibacillus]MDF9839065.1 hypothetical protein [Paenibacillus sp. PastF-2]MDF9845647.1 hypothetical protein [Paenibacillus sp. PastM-2]MDF9852219.1 hypothetical protein [Paenibacillus sp. PastF-1]MDH6478052.1 hypothetical protein [Paenibacillus sp. PastH-2]MDH6505787.1 hypothetical protein [Paenibacillus sp. PastM-3]
MEKELFELGEIVVTPGATELITQFGVLFVLNCHVSGNYGNVSEMDWKLNQWAISHGERIVSTYSGIWEKAVFVVTERDRSVTTVLLGEEY